MVRRHPALIVVAVVTLLVVGLAGAGAQQAMQAEPTAVAVVDLERVFDQLEEMSALEADANSKAEQIQKQAEEKRQEVQQLQSDLGLLKAGTEEHRQAQEEVEMAAIEFRTWLQFQKQKLERERGVMVEGLYRKTLDAVEQVADGSGYDLVLYKARTTDLNFESARDLAQRIQARKVLYADDALDITDEVVQRMNNTYNAR